MSAIMTSLRTRERRPAVAAAVALALQDCGGGNNSTPPVPPPTVNISVSPASITLGQATTLTWSSTQAASCSASGGWSGSQQPMGSAIEPPSTAGTVTYSLTCTGTAGGGGSYGGGTTAPTASQSATLTNNPAPPPTAFRVTKLVADGAGVGATQDPD